MDFQECLSAFKTARRELSRAIKESKKQCFKRICDEAELNPWGTAYKVVMKRIKGNKSPQISCPVMMKKIVETLFPARALTTFNMVREIDPESVPAVTIEEVLQACRKIHDRKAPGPDGVPNKALKAAVNKRPDMFVKVMGKCLLEGVFPDKWKLQHLVLLPKGKKPPDEPSSYRPICLLDTMGKILEGIIYNRLLSIVEDKGALSNRQFGFRKNRSTVDAIKTVVDIAASAIEGTRWRWGDKKYCAVVTLDVKNAFNTASWHFIRRCLAAMDTPYYLIKIIESYLTARKLRYNTDEGRKFYSVSAGVPQGSVLGPLLWIIMYDGILKLQMPPGTEVIGFADDIAVTTVAKSLGEVEAAVNEAVARIRSWLQTAGLELADHKTEAILITSRKKKEYINVRVGNETIRSKESLKYLGVMLDSRLNFKPHIEYASKKASLLQAALAGMLPNIGGPRQGKRLLLSRVVSSVLLYAAPVWAKALQVQESRRKLSSVYRLSALRTISGFRTISDEAALVIAGMIPIDILADEMARIYERKPLGIEANNGALKKTIRAEERMKSLEAWKSRWDGSTKGRWTYKLIPNIESWLTRRHGDCNYQLTQFLSGHGGYRKYLHRFGHDNSPLCPSCPDQEEDAEHAMFHCSRFANWRGSDLNPEALIGYMLQSEENWENACNMVTQIQLELRRLERIRNEDNTGRPLA